MNSKRNKWIVGLAVGLAAAMLSGTLYARDPGINQPGVVGGTAGLGAPGVGTYDPGINQPGALGNVGVGTPGVGVGAPGAGVRDPGINQPGAVGNTGPARRSLRR
jgi:hypothetical protein